MQTFVYSAIYRQLDDTACSSIVHQSFACIFGIYYVVRSHVVIFILNLCFTLIRYACKSIQFYLSFFLAYTC